jgi:Protein of unknown function (DUF2585)
MQKWLVAVGGIIAIQALTLYLFGQPPICTCGYVKVWEGGVFSSGNSQHLFDWYTFTHIIHGFLFYALLWVIFPHMSVWQRLVIATGIEAAWEITENTPMVIQHYRKQALAQGYSGDSIINSVMDTLSMVVGFLFAWRAPLYASVSIGVFLELWVGYSIRDNLTLNVINLIYQFDFIKNWQSGSPAVKNVLQ